MIWDEIKNLQNYRALCPDLDYVSEFLGKINRSEIELSFPARYELAPIEKGIFALAQEYYPKKREDDLVIETHRLFIDIQIVLKGSELVGYASRDLLTVLNEYDHTKDFEAWKGLDTLTFLPLRRGEFFLFFPFDAHLPGVQMEGKQHDDNEKIKKLVIKVPANLFYFSDKLMDNGV